ncbi:uncharacterized protein LOC121836582 [Ixodes scapularis]|uniref:uncharacterized protein LOC121836582 n=1 Tax=Ixodes scapularis TaxID=6945 RepID=UPI001C3910FB|nr:uncharacterized protein LOC121836582 [Ixodes scapularis]
MAKSYESGKGEGKMPDKLKEPDDASEDEGRTDSEVMNTRLEIEKIKLEQIRAQIELQKLQKENGGGADGGLGLQPESGVAHYAALLTNVLSRMPGDKTLVPGWFEAVEVIFRSFQVPDEIKTVLIMPYIADRVRSAIMCSGMKELPSYAQLKERILRELRLSPNEYKRLFTTAGKLREESWSQFAGRLNSYFSYYVNSRKVDTYDDLLQLVVADRLKESLPNEIKAYVALNETGEWLRPEAIAKLAECHQESNAQRVPKPYHKTDTTGDSSQSESMTPPKERGHTEYVGDTRRCFACGKQGHLARNCPETNPKLTARVKRPLDCEHAEQSIEVHDELVSLTEQHEVLDEERFVQLRSGDKRLNARVDSGADITVVRRSMATILDENQKGKVRLKGAFGHEVEADLMFAQGMVMYLGHQIGSGRHAPDPVRIKAIQIMERPKTKKELKSFLGLMNYYRDYIANYAEVVLPLTARTGDRTPNVLPWGDEEEQAFQKAKCLLMEVPVMRAPDASQPFVLSTDASDRAIGACLAQRAGDGKEYPVAFLSKKLTDPQTRWAVIEREAYAIVWALVRAVNGNTTSA